MTSEENKPIPASVQVSNEELKKLGAREKDGKLKVRGKAHEKVLKEDKNVNLLRTSTKKNIQGLVDVMGKEEFISAIENLNQKELRENKEQAELLENLKLQYPKMVQTLKRYETPLKGMPSWENVQKGLTPEVLQKALKLDQPTLILVPPTSRQDKVKALDTHKVEGQRTTYVRAFAANDLWNGGREKQETAWRVLIVTGIQDVQADPAINPREMKTCRMAEKAWVKKYAEKELNVMNDADAYLTLMMASLSEGKPVDKDFLTVLNAKNNTNPSFVAYGRWNVNEVYLYCTAPVNPSDFLRLRGSVVVDVPEN